MGWWGAGAVLAALTMWAVWDAGRRSQASPAALGLMRVVGGLGLLIIGAHAVENGAGPLALIAAGPALALLAGIFHGIRAPKGDRPAADAPATPPERLGPPANAAPAAPAAPPVAGQERRAA